MNFQILISTVNSNFLKKIKSIPAKYILINQYDDITAITSKNYIYNFNERGLAKSRNHAIKLAEADICLVSDDDLEYKKNIEAIILDAFLKNDDADIITFQVETPDGNMYKKYRPTPFWHRRKSIMSVSSVEIAFKMASVQRVGLKFDENFGLGSKFPTGEEVIFLTDALKKNLNILYIPIPIVIHPAESSGKNYDNIALIEAKGAMFFRLFGYLGYVASALFAYKKHSFSPYSLRVFMFNMFSGIKKYRSTINE